MKENTNKDVYLKSTATAALLSLGVLFLGNTGGQVSQNTREYISQDLMAFSEYGQAPILNQEQELSTYENSIRTAKINYNLPGIPSRNLASYKSKTVVIGTAVQKKTAPVINGITYVSVSDISSTVAGARTSYNSNTKTLTVTATGLYMSMTDGGYVIYANDRPLFSFSPTIVMSNGEVYAPASAIEKALGIVRKSDTGTSIAFTGAYKPLATASKFYRDDEVYWLSKIISAESSGESLIGQIAVGDVILNRVKSPLFPNTIYSVIFDRKYGVQFSPTADGRIYGSPTFTATLAAKICLEGVSLSDDAIYFLNPRAAQSNWIVNNRQYVYTIGNHDFYK